MQSHTSERTWFNHLNNKPNIEAQMNTGKKMKGVPNTTKKKTKKRNKEIKKS
jgi:hypothetical protein